MKVYEFTNYPHLEWLACDCCEAMFLDSWESPDFEWPCYTTNDCYKEVLEKETGIDWFEESEMLTDVELELKLKEMGIEVVFHEED